MSVRTPMPPRIAGWAWTTYDTRSPVLYDTHGDALSAGLQVVQLAMQENPTIAPVFVSTEYVELTADEDIRAYMAQFVEV